MQYNEFINQLKDRANLENEEQAVRTARATLRTLAERITGDEAKDVASQLPEGLEEFMDAKSHGERFSLDEFYERVGKKADIDTNDAMTRSKALFSILNEAITKGEMNDVRDQLPKDYSELFSSN